MYVCNKFYRCSISGIAYVSIFVCQYCSNNQQKRLRNNYTTRLKWWSKDSSVITHICIYTHIHSVVKRRTLLQRLSFSLLSAVLRSRGFQFHSDLAGDYLPSDCRNYGGKKGNDGLFIYIASRLPSVSTKSPRFEFHQCVNRCSPRFCFDAGLQSEHDWRRLRIVTDFALRMVFCSSLENKETHYVAFKSPKKWNIDETL